MFNYEKFHKHYSNMKLHQKTNDFWNNKTNISGLNENLIFLYA